MIENKIKYIFFDAGDTLFEVRGSVGFHYSRVALKHGVQIAPDRLNKKFKTAIKEMHPMAFPGASPEELEHLERQWWYTLAQPLFDGVPTAIFDRIFNDLYCYFGSGIAWRLFPETTEVLEQLQKMGYLLGIISNFDSRLTFICKDLNILGYFEVVLFSTQEGIAKPSTEIFKRALNRTGLSPSEAIYIGDNLHHDIAGPREIGMTPLLLNRSGHFKTPGNLIYITSLSDIFKFL